MFGRLTILAYGTMMNPESARKTCPSADNFRLVDVRGFRRIFKVIHVRAIKDGDLNASEMEIAAAAAQKHGAYNLRCVAFDISMNDLKSLWKRRREYKYSEAKYEDIETGLTGTGLICEESEDWEVRSRAFPLQDDYNEFIGNIYSGKIWRDDILPSRAYVRECLQAASEWGESTVKNFMEASVLCDNKTVLKKYWAKLKN